MTIDRSTLVFFDASCLIAAAGSVGGGSGFLMALCANGFLRAAVSQPVLLEADRNILKNWGISELVAYKTLFGVTPMLVAPLPDEDTIARHEQAVGKKDAHVVAAVLAARAPFLLTLDKRLERRVKAAQYSFRVLSPGEFIKTVLPEHAEFPRLRQA